MLVITADTIPNQNYQVLGLVQGSTVQSKHIGKDFGASFKTIVGGEIKGYTQMIDDARKQAMERMIAQANAINADAIVALRFASSAIMQGAAEMCTYGTAVKFI